MQVQKPQRRVACREIIDRLSDTPNPTGKDLNRIKIEVCKKLQSDPPSNSELISLLNEDERKRLLSILKLKHVRTISGVTVVAVMTKPYPCPKDKPCAYCPGGPRQGVPQSYTGHEPAAMRGIQNQYDPYRQVASRVVQLREIGHRVDKVELIVMGGTFLGSPREYQQHFVKGCLDALNGLKSNSLEEAKRVAESPEAEMKIVGITFETRPDLCMEPHVDLMLSYGVTRVEIGVQNLYDDVYRLVGRGHTVQDVADAFQKSRDAGLKIVAHMMPGLPGSDFDRDLDAFKRLFEDPSFKPDMLKIYPCLVLEGTKLHDWWAEGSYRPYTTQEAAELVARVKEIAPAWLRIMRVQRDIPSKLILAGVTKSNLRELALANLKSREARCRCIRCRETGHRMLKDGVKPDLDRVRLVTQSYEASGGIEVFISLEDPVEDILLGYVRLRIPSTKAHRPEITSEKTAVVRELRVHGPLVPVGEYDVEAYQHRGYGKMLLKEAERIAVDEFSRRKVAVMSALGTKQYYVRLGYSFDGPYMSRIF